MPTLFLTEASKTYDGNRQSLQQILLGKVVICLQKVKLNLCLSFVLISTQNGSRTLINIRPDTLINSEKRREYSASNRYRQGLPQ
jgi:hypothetical protein